MNTTRTAASRLSAAVASMAITFSILTGVATYAKPPVASPLLAQAGATIVR